MLEPFPNILDRNAAIREFSFSNGNTPTWEYFYGSEDIWGVIVCDELYAITTTTDGYACAGYIAGNTSKIPDYSKPFDYYQPEFLVLENVDYSGDSDAYIYNIEDAGNYDPEDTCGRDILQFIDGTEECLISCGWFLERNSTGNIMRGYIEKRNIGESTPDYTVIFSDNSKKYNCEFMYMDNGLLFVSGGVVENDIRKEMVWVLDSSDLGVLDSSSNSASDGNLLMGSITKIDSEYFVTCGENYDSPASASSPNDLAITLWEWDSTSGSGVVSVVDERTYTFNGFRRQGSFDALVVENALGDPIGLYVFCNAEEDIWYGISYGILVAYVPLQDLNTNPSLGTSAQYCLFMEPDDPDNLLTDGNEVEGGSINCVSVNGETVVVCVGGAVVEESVDIDKTAIWICSVTDVDDPPTFTMDSCNEITSPPVFSENCSQRASITPSVNPSIGCIELYYQNTSAISIYDIYGRTVWSSDCYTPEGNLLFDSTSLEENGFEPGKYFVKAHSPNGNDAVCSVLILN